MTDSTIPVSPFKGLAPNKVCVIPVDAEAAMETTLLVPDMAKETPSRGTVIHSTVDWVNPGDVVFYGKYSGTEVAYKGKVYLFLGEDNLLSTV